MPIHDLVGKLRKKSTEIDSSRSLLAKDLAGMSSGELRSRAFCGPVMSRMELHTASMTSGVRQRSNTRIRRNTATKKKVRRERRGRGKRRRLRDISLVNDVLRASAIPDLSQVDSEIPGGFITEKTVSVPSSIRSPSARSAHVHAAATEARVTCNGAQRTCNVRDHYQGAELLAGSPSVMAPLRGWGTLSSSICS
eukprot:IDg939t1